MARKVKSFADKMLSKADTSTCPVCNEVLQNLVVFQTQKMEGSESDRYIRNKVKVCKCNEQEVYS